MIGMAARTAARSGKQEYGSNGEPFPHLFSKGACPLTSIEKFQKLRGNDRGVSTTGRGRHFVLRFMILLLMIFVGSICGYSVSI